MGQVHPHLVLVPSDDAEFAEHVAVLVGTPDGPEWPAGLQAGELQRRIRQQFPNATVRPRHVLARLLPEDAPIWYVSKGRERFRLRAAVQIEAPREDVFRIYVDPGRIDQWQVVARARPLASSAAVVGNAWEAEFEILRARLGGTFRIVEADSPARIRVEAHGPLRSRLWYVSRFYERDGGTLLEVEGDYELPFEWLTRVPSRLVAEREIERTVARSHDRLKALCESSRVRGAATGRSHTRSTRASRS